MANELHVVWFNARLSIVRTLNKKGVKQQPNKRDASIEIKEVTIAF